MVEPLNDFDDTIAIGIDLGTTMSVVAVWKSAKNDAEIIKNESGNTITPSVVAYTPE
jgi:molecular chaperone HscC